jgi:hypothetical protein
VTSPNVSVLTALKTNPNKMSCLRHTNVEFLSDVKSKEWEEECASNAINETYAYNNPK